MIRLPTRSSLLLVTLLALGSTAHAQSRMFVGGRNLAMGGTGVGGTSDAMAVYYNPAGMAFSGGWEVQLPLISMDAELEGQTLSTIDTLLVLFEDADLLPGPKRIVYISCDTATLARDLGLAVRKGYRIDRMIGFDMFPQTAHLESLVRLVRV